MQNPMLYSCVGAKFPRSYLFTGAPGTGKTYSANIINNELGKIKKPKHVFMMPYNIGTYGTAYINQGSVIMQQYFDYGKELLMNPELNVDSVIYFFDEVDALMGKRGNSHGSKEDDKVLETLMKNLQAIDDRQMNEYFIAATNFPELLDEAATRSGRINHKIKFELPDYDCRKELFEGYINKINNAAGYKVLRNINVSSLAEMSNKFNCADIEACLDRALNKKIKAELRTKPKGIIPAYWIGQKWLEEEVRQMVSEKDIKVKNPIGFMR